MHRSGQARAVWFALASFLLFTVSIPAPVAAAPPARCKEVKTSVRDRHCVPDKVIVSFAPTLRSRISRFISKLLGKGEGETLAITQSKVWTVPSIHAKVFVEGLRKLGGKVALLGPDWNHLLRRYQGRMAAAQDEMFKNARGAPGFVGMGVMSAQEASVTEYALTGGAATAHTKKPKSSVSRIIIPVNDTRQVVVQRVEAITTAKGTTWRGTLEDSGESAILMWWKDGHMSGVFSHKGHIYTIVNVGGEVHAVTGAGSCGIQQSPH
jgi:hypothetical protein